MIPANLCDQHRALRCINLTEGLFPELLAGVPVEPERCLIGIERSAGKIMVHDRRQGIVRSGQGCVRRHHSSSLITRPPLFAGIVPVQDGSRVSLFNHSRRMAESPGGDASRPPPSLLPGIQSFVREPGVGALTWPSGPHGHLPSCTTISIILSFHPHAPTMYLRPQEVKPY